MQKNTKTQKMINTSPVSILLCILLHLTTTTPQPTPPTAMPPPPPHPFAPLPSPGPAPAPPASPPSITKILQKAKRFSRFLGIMKQTQVVRRLQTDLKNPKTSQGLTILAPSNNAFSGMKSGALNSLSSDQLSKLVLFHCVQTFLSLSDFQATTNPLNTEAGDASNGQFTLNVTTTGNQVNFSTGVGSRQATVLGTVYLDADRQLAVYEVSGLLLPMAIFPVPPFEEAPAPAPVPEAGPTGPTSGTKRSGGGEGSSDAGGGSTSDGYVHRVSSGGGAVLLVVGVLMVLW